MKISNLVIKALLAGSLFVSSANAEEVKKELDISYLRNRNVEEINVDAFERIRGLPLYLIFGLSHDTCESKQDVLLHLGLGGSIKKDRFRLMPYVVFAEGMLDQRDISYMDQTNFSSGIVLDYGVFDRVRLGCGVKHIDYINGIGTPSEVVSGINLVVR